MFREVLGVGATPGADLEDPAADMRADQVEDPCRVVLGLFERVEDVTEILVGCVERRRRACNRLAPERVAHQPRSTKAVAEPRVTHDAVHGPRRVTPSDLLAVGVCAPGVRDTHLVDPPSALGDLGGDLRFEPEAILLDRDRLNDLATEELVARFHVGQVETGEHVGGEGQHPVAESSARSTTPGAGDRIGTGTRRRRRPCHRGSAAADRRTRRGRIRDRHLAR